MNDSRSSTFSARARPAVAGLRLAGQGEPVRGDVRELLGDEVAGAGGQQEHGQQAEDGARGTQRRVDRAGRESVGVADTGLLLL
ncbi:hypothetical protein RKD19_001861 [Streptomyces canus]